MHGQAAGAQIHIVRVSADHQKRKHIAKAPDFHNIRNVFAVSTLQYIAYHPVTIKAKSSAQRFRLILDTSTIAPSKK